MDLRPKSHHDESDLVCHENGSYHRANVAISGTLLAQAIDIRGKENTRVDLQRPVSQQFVLVIPSLEFVVKSLIHRESEVELISAEQEQQSRHD